ATGGDLADDPVAADPRADQVQLRHRGEAVDGCDPAQRRRLEEALRGFDRGEQRLNAREDLAAIAARGTHHFCSLVGVEFEGHPEDAMDLPVDRERHDAEPAVADWPSAPSIA